MIKIKMQNRIFTIDDWTPYFFILKDFLFNGDWEDVYEALKGSKSASDQIENCRSIETAFDGEINSELFLPTTALEIRDFFQSFEISPEKIKNYIAFSAIHEYANEMILEEDYQEAEELARLMTDFDADCAYAYDIFGTIAFDKGQIAKSIETLEKACELNPDLDEAYSTLGQAYFNNGEYDRSANVWERLIEKNPDDVLAYFTLVDAYLQQNKINDAIASLRMMVERFPSHLMGKINLISLLKKAGRGEEAAAYEHEVEQTQPQNSTELEIWARMNLEKQNYELVEEGIKKFLLQNNGPAFLKLWLVVPYVKSGKIDEAKRIISEFRESNILFNYGKHEIFDPFLEEKEIWECELPC